MFALIPSVGLQRSDVTCRMSIGCCVEVTRFPSDVLSLDLSERHWKVILNRVSTCTSDRDAWWCTGVLLDAVTSLLAVVTGGTGWNAAARFLNVWPETVVHDDNLLLIVKVLICKQVKLQLKSTFLTESHWTHHRGPGPDDDATVEEEVVVKATSWGLKQSWQKCEGHLRSSSPERQSEHTPVVTTNCLLHVNLICSVQPLPVWNLNKLTETKTHQRVRVEKRKVTFIHVSASVCCIVYSQYPWKPSWHDDIICETMNSGSSEILLHRLSN